MPTKRSAPPPDDRHAPTWRVPNTRELLARDDLATQLHDRPGRDSLDPFQYDRHAIAMRRQYATDWPGHIWWDENQTRDASVALRPKAILLSFLACKTPDQFERFINKFGPPYLCERHGLPYMHDSDLIDRGPRCHLFSIGGANGRFAIAFAWLALWRDAFATLLKIADRLEPAGATVDAELWGEIDFWIPTNLDARQGGGNASRAGLGKDPGLDRVAFASAVTILLTWAHVRPNVLWHSKWPEFIPLDVSGTNVFGPLVLGLVAGFTGLRKIVSCEYCADLFEPEQPRIRYCSACRLAKVPQRLAMRRRDEARRQQRSAPSSDDPQQ